MTAKDFYELMRRAGKTEDITSNPDPDYNQPFYQAIFNLMDEYVTAKNHWVEGFGTSRLYFSPTWDRVERAALTEQGRRKDNPLNWGTTDGVHIMYTYRGKFHAALKTWDFERTERVLKRLGASYWEIAVTDDVPCPHRKKTW